MYTCTVRCKSCGRVLSTAHQVAPENVQTVAQEAAMLCFCPEPGHSYNSNLRLDWTPPPQARPYPAYGPTMYPTHPAPYVQAMPQPVTRQNGNGHVHTQKNSLGEEVTVIPDEAIKLLIDQSKESAKKEGVTAPADVTVRLERPVP